MTTLRQRNLEDMQVRSLLSQTRATYMQQVSLFARPLSSVTGTTGPRGDSLLPNS
jgi:hypothetical protein